MMSQIFNFFIIIIFSNYAYSESQQFKAFVAGDYSSMNSIILSLESFDPILGTQVGTILSTLNLDKNFQRLNHNYKECIFNLTSSNIDFTFDELFLELNSKCIDEKKLISSYIKELSKNN